ncbi:VanZ family protein [Saccharopolyspora hordei]|uniref:VanZ family protein n=1 Tax=Saccharopolyspora hordei TaxID=1838 RepID=A0A853AFY0_9PSEU|nr:VanZ family protein [Saccharopolyspora hordei]
MIAVAVSLLVLFMPASGVPTAPPGTDKVVHAALFAALALTGRTAGIPAVTLLPALAGYAAVSEVLQGLLPIGRSCDVVDGLVDVAGAAIGWAVVALTRKVSGRSSP